MATLIRQVILKNFKSISTCRVDLRDISLLVGPNGAGKSNFIDGFRLISDALNSTLEYAIRQRGGINEVRRRSGGHPTHFAISLRLNLGNGMNGHYALRVGAKPEGAFTVQREQATVSKEGLTDAFFVVEDGNVINASEEFQTLRPKVESDRLYLTSISGVAEFRVLFDALSGMSFYNIHPEPIKELQPHDSGDRLDRNGWNLAAVIKRLREDQPENLQRIQEYLKQIVPGIEEVSHKSYGPRETLEFRQAVQGQSHPWRFHAAYMSDGTLRSLGILTALFHQTVTEGKSIPFVAIEEPEITIHPAAASIIMDALFEASKKEQVLATTHSPDLLDHPDIKSDSILAVQNIEGETQILPVDEAAVSAIRESLYTAGDLLRVNQLTPNSKLKPKRISDRDLFGQS
ncbi:MAG: AAA family ATPase [Alphaproteobacteria bacterium]